MSDHAGTVIVLAKAPRPGRVKTRLQPAFTASEAAGLAAAALEDTVAAVRSCAATRRILAWEGDRAWWQEGLEVIDQPAGTLNLRLTAAFAAALSDPLDEPALLIGMDTPQVTAQLLDSDWEGADAVLGLSEDGGFWAIGLRYGHPHGLFDGIPMSTSRTGSAQLARLFDSGLSVKLLPPLRDVDRPEDAESVAAQFPGLDFSRKYAELMSGRRRQSSDRLFDAAYTGITTVSNLGRAGIKDENPLPLDISRWSGPADAVDMLVVARCEPPVIDLGCGPGRMVQALTESGQPALGVDMSSVAVELSRARGGLALRRRIDEPLPAEGRWGTALLMDTNVGLGGDVAALLARCIRLVHPGGLIICEVDLVPERHEVHTVVLRTHRATSPLLSWSRIGASALLEVSPALDLLLVEEWTSGTRAFVALRSMRLGTS
jgi:rSAM/selenodomain-associated transferase 1